MRLNSDPVRPDAYSYYGVVYDATKPPSGTSSLITERDPALHAEKRKTWNRGFTPAALREYDEPVIKRTVQLLERLGQQSGTIDLGKWISYYTSVVSLFALSIRDLRSTVF